MHLPSTLGPSAQRLLSLAATTAMLLSPPVLAGTYGMSSKSMKNSTMGGSAKADHTFYDYIVVGSGPGGATVARLLSDDPKNKVLLIEAGENRDNDPPITDSADAWIVPVDYVPEYFWQIAMLHNNFEYGTHEWPAYPSRRVVEEFYAEEVEEGKRRQELEDAILNRRFGGGKTKGASRQRRALAEKVHRRLHGYEGEMSMEQYMGGRLMGGSSSINGQQYVWPTKQLLESIQAEVGGDEDWSPENVYALLRELENYEGSSPQARGTEGPLNVKQAPANATASKAGNDFVASIINATGVSLLDDYNDPETPIGAFLQWQLTQNPDGSRASSSTSMLNAETRARKNLVIKTRATAMYVKFKKNVAQGIYYTHAGIGQTAYARKEVIIAAGHRSSLLLENSGVGDARVIEPLLHRVGFEMVADVPGVGAYLGNDGVLMLKLNRSDSTEHRDATPNDLYSGGAFLPWPNATTANHFPQTTQRFSQLLGTDQLGGEEGLDFFHIGVILLNTSSNGFAHIQSADPLYAPLVTARTFNDKMDRANWWYLLRFQVKPIIDQMMERGYTLISPEYSIFTDPTKNVNMKNLFEYLFQNYIPAHHWFGTCKMGTDPKQGAVTDSGGRVYGVKRLRVADASIFPIKLDGNTGVPAYIAGGVIAKKILAGK
ncbi:glucose-methanol-choline oxidoreductase [Nannochloropsis oceanica]